METKRKYTSVPEKDQKEKAVVTVQYDCGQECRICPFPGAKCVNNPELWNDVK